MNAKQVLDREFLEIRCKILEIAAALDRQDRADGFVDSDPRVRSLREALQVLLSDGPNRAELVQMIFSRQYEPNWREEFGVSGKRKAR
jgi:hypothetical protein